MVQTGQPEIACGVHLFLQVCLHAQGAEAQLLDMHAPAHPAAAGRSGGAVASGRGDGDRVRVAAAMLLDVSFGPADAGGSKALDMEAPLLLGGEDPLPEPGNLSGSHVLVLHAMSGALLSLMRSVHAVLRSFSVPRRSCKEVFSWSSASRQCKVLAASLS